MYWKHDVVYSCVPNIVYIIDIFKVLCYFNPHYLLSVHEIKN